MFDIGLERIESVFFARNGGAFGAKRRTQGVVSKQAAKCTDERNQIPPGNKQTVRTVTYKVEHATARCGNHRLAESHCLKKNEAKTFTHTWHGEDVGARIAGCKLFARQALQKTHSIRTPGFVRQFLQAREIIAAANRHKMQIREFRSKLRDREDQIIRAFVLLGRCGAGDSEDHLTGGKSAR